jgi:hypothetical protein
MADDDQVGGERNFKGSRWGWNLMGAMSALLAGAFASAWILSSYFKVDVAASLVYSGNDGYCDPGSRGLGVHCWVDYASIQFTSLNAPPLAGEALYPLSSRIIRLPFFALDHLVDPRAATYIYLIVSAVCVLAPMLWATARMAMAQRLIVITVGGVCTVPFAAVIDRGNLIALTVPLMLVFVVALVRESPWVAAAAVVAMSTVKPQFAILALALATRRLWLPALASFVGAMLAVGLPFLIQREGIGVATSSWADQVEFWLGATPLSNSWPVNLSLAHLFEIARRLVSGAALPPTQGQADPNYVAGAGVVAVELAFVMLVAVVVLVAGHRLHALLTAATFLAIVALAMPVSWNHYSVFILPVLAIIVRSGPEGWPTRGLLDRAITVVLSAGVCLGLTLLIIPREIIEIRDGSRIAVSITPELMTAAWLAFLLLVAVRAITVRATPEPRRPIVVGSE